MKFAVCCVTCASPEQVGAILEPLRPLAEQIVIAYDDRVEASHKRRYREIADRAFSLTFEVVERHLAALHRACDSEWVLRIDTDEVPSSALVAELSALNPATDARLYAIPRCWLDPSGRGWIDETPWYPDYQLRLVRNDGQLRFSGEVHSSVTPIAAPVLLTGPLYHLDCVVSSREDRQRKALVYDIMRPGLVAHQGLPMVSYYDPELYATLPLASVPEVDRAEIGKILAVGGAAPCTVDTIARSPLVKRRTSMSPPRGKVRLELLERDVRLFTCHPRLLSAKVTNWSDATLVAARPGDDHPIGLATRLSWPDGTVREGPRTPLPTDLSPRASLVLQARVDPVERSGPVELKLDLVQEAGRCRDCICVVCTTSVPSFEPAERREPPMRGRRRRVWRRRRTSGIPRVVHRVWLGDRALSADHLRYGESWKENHPTWKHRLWRDEDIPHLAILDRARHLAERTDIVRYEILRRHGGVSVDTDVECLRPLDDLLAGVDAFAAYAVPGQLCNAVMGGVLGHPALRRLCELIEYTVGRGEYPWATATTFVTRVFEPRSDVTLFGPERFYPYLWNKTPEAARMTHDTYAVCHWAKSGLQLA